MASGDVDFLDALAAPDGFNIQGLVRWYQEPILRATRFADGFDVPVSLFGASYVAPKRGQNVINLANSPAAVEFGAGDLSQDPLVLLPLELPTLNESRVLRNVAEKFSLQVIPSTGVFQGSFREPSGKARSFRGILLQPAGVGLGFYLQEAGTGTVGNGGGDPGPK